jgi:hypothetical protein
VIVGAALGVGATTYGEAKTPRFATLFDANEAKVVSARPGD